MSEDYIDPERLQLPRKESKIGALAKNSRQASPVDAQTPLGVEPRKFGSLVGRKRKYGSMEVRLISPLVIPKHINICLLAGFY